MAGILSELNYHEVKQASFLWAFAVLAHTSTLGQSFRALTSVLIVNSCSHGQVELLVLG